MSFLYDYVGNLILSLAQVCSWYIITGKKSSKNKMIQFVYILILSFFITINHNYINNFAKGVGVILLALIFSKLILNLKLNESIILSFVSELLVIFSEAILVLIFTVIFKMDMNTIASSLYIHIIFDILISLLVVIISRIKVLIRLYHYLTKVTKNINNYQILFFVLFSIFAVTSVFTGTYFKNNIHIVIVLNIIVSFVYSLIIILVFNFQNRYYRVKSKYNTSLDSLHSQELIISEYRIMNHENKNQLMTIKSMCSNKNVINYINSLINYKEEFNDEILNLTLKIPEGGIRGLIYSKILYMKKNNILCNLQVDKLITAKSLNYINDNDMVDICQILGVFIDNSIEEVICFEHKIINIDLHISDDYLHIIISNPYNSNKSNILESSKGSSKGSSRGYGLQLVKRIVDNNPRLSNEREISKDLFIQKLLVKLKK